MVASWGVLPKISLDGTPCSAPSCQPSQPHPCRLRVPAYSASLRSPSLLPRVGRRHLAEPAPDVAARAGALGWGAVAVGAGPPAGIRAGVRAGMWRVSRGRVGDRRPAGADRAEETRP